MYSVGLKLKIRLNNLLKCARLLNPLSEDARETGRFSSTISLHAYPTLISFRKEMNVLPGCCLKYLQKAVGHIFAFSAMS